MLGFNRRGGRGTGGGAQGGRARTWGIARGAASVAEGLEGRRLLTVLLDPIFGVETQKQGNGEVLNHPPINIVFWGPYWQGGNGSDESKWDSALSPEAEKLIIATETLINSTYFDITRQYGVDPSEMFVNDVAWKSGTPNNKFSTSDLDDVVQDKIENGPFPEPDNQKGLHGQDQKPIYLVITQPGVSSSDPNAAGYNIVPLDFFFPHFERTPEIWVGTATDNTGKVSVDRFTKFLSHEIAEIITDYNQNGYEVNTPPAWTGGGDDQIGDKEANSYFLRMSNGIDVQALWSAKDLAYAISDGTSQIFNLHPNWNGNSFTGTYNLKVIGDQNFTNMKDDVVVGTNAGGGVQLTLDGETVSYDAGQISKVTLETGFFENTVTYNGLPGGVTMNAQSTFGSVDLTVPSAAGTQTIWEIGAKDAVRVNSVATFVDATNLTGGAGADHFDFTGNGSLSGNIDGGPGFSNFITYPTTQTTPATTNDVDKTTSRLGGHYTHVGNFVAHSTAGGTFIGPDGQWTINAPNQGLISGLVGFTGYTTLQTGAGDDSFKFTGTGKIGAIDAGLGNDTMDVSALTLGVVVNLQLGSALSVAASIAGLENFVGRIGGSDNLIGPDVASAWALTGSRAGTVGGVSFTGFDFIAGGAGDDVFAFEPGGTIGRIAGGGGTNTLDYSALAGPISVDLHLGTAYGTSFGIADITNVIGSQSTADTIVGPDAAWVINGTNVGSVNGITFSSIENLQGSADLDTFTFMPGGSVAGDVDGGGGPDTLDYSNLTTPVTLNFSTSSATGIGGKFKHITAFVGGQGTNNVVGPATATTWTVTGVNTVSALGTTFTNLPNVTGGTADDTFTFLQGGRLDGKIDGGGGADTLVYSAVVGDVVVNLPLHTATRVGQGVFNVRNVIAGVGNSLLVGDAAANTLVGGTGRSVLIGGAGSDVLVGSAAAENILIADGTTFDANAAALAAIFAEWTRADVTFQKRVSDLISTGGGGLNGAYTLDKKSIVVDSASDVLMGGSGMDWFFDDKKLDTIAGGQQAGDRVTGV